MVSSERIDTSPNSGIRAMNRGSCRRLHVHGGKEGGRGMGDQALVRRILGGDRAAGERWVTAEYPRIYRLLRHLTGAVETAEDLTQQTFLKAWQALATFRGEASLRTWLHRIA